jgi:hypothetical protein
MAAPPPPEPRQPIRLHPNGIDAIKNPINGLQLPVSGCFRTEFLIASHITYMGVGFAKVLRKCPSLCVYGERYIDSKTSLGMTTLEAVW